MSVPHPKAVAVNNQGVRKRRKLNLLPYQFLLPSIILIALVNVYPMFTGLIYSFKDGTMAKSGNFVGLSNFAELLKMDDFWHALYFSSIFSVFSVVGSYALGLLLAILLNKEVMGRGFFRVALMVPWIVPSVVSIVGWRWMIGDQHGMVNTFLGYFGISPILFLATEKWAVVSVIVVKIWRSFPFMMISILAGLSTISQDLYESASIDGAGRWKSFWHITMPQLKMISIVCWILMTIWCFNDFETIWLLTEGGPANATENLIVIAFKYTFIKNSVGIGAAIAIVSLILLMALALLLLRNQDRDED
jgi:ABC-type sugar transport system permease subunit